MSEAYADYLADSVDWLLTVVNETSSKYNGLYRQNCTPIEASITSIIFTWKPTFHHRITIKEQFKIIFVLLVLHA